ncbi:23S rRNA (adenine(2030)-N(6))-methyltransferase RlmJ, partial [Xanthomonas perforans]
MPRSIPACGHGLQVEVVHAWRGTTGAHAALLAASRGLWMSPPCACAASPAMGGNKSRRSLYTAAMNYRHAFHAGNHADVLKHIALLALIDTLKRKDTPFFVLDTHAG